MKSGLSAMKFVRNNKKQVNVIIIAVALTFMVMYVVNFLLSATTESFKSIFLEAPKETAYFNLSAATLGIDVNAYESNEEADAAYRAARAEVIEKLQAHEGIGNVYFTQVIQAVYAGIGGSVAFEFPLLNEEEIAGYLAHVGGKLTEGEMPKEPGDVLVDKNIAKNQKLKVGNYFQESWYGKTFKVCGITETNNMQCVGIPNGYTNSGWYFVVECDEKNCTMEPVLKDIGYTLTSYDKNYDSIFWAENYKEQVADIIDAVIGGILIVVTLFLAVSILVTYIAFMRNRAGEYCLYTSIGYGRSEVYGMIMREIGIIFGISILLGIIITVPSIFIFDLLLLKPAGLLCRYWDYKQFLRIITAFVGIAGAMQIPIIVTINKIKTIDMIEE